MRLTGAFPVRRCYDTRRVLTAGRGRMWASDSAYTSTANTHPSACRAEIAPVLFDHREVAALDALHSLHFRRRAFGRCLENSHRLHRIAVLVEDAEHGIAVDDETRNV